MNNLMSAIAASMQQDEEDQVEMSPGEKVHVLRQCYAELGKVNTFAPGDLVTWKPGLKNRRVDGPMIVVEVLDTPVLAELNESGSPYFREVLDLKIGIVDTDADFLIFHMGSNRLMPLEQ